MMSRSIYTVPEVMDVLEVISEKEEGRFSDLPRWSGQIMAWTDKAVLLEFDGQARWAMRWFPLSQLRKAADGQSIYASQWIMEQNGVV